MRLSFPASASKLAAVTVMVALVAACAGDKNKDALPPDQPVNALYAQGDDALNGGNFKEAAKQFAEVERQHPYSPWATHAQIMEAYAYYLNMDYDESIKVLDEFIELHPGNTDTAYAYYLRGLCNYERISTVDRDQTATRDALKDFQAVLDRYPETAYAKDAVLKIGLINNQLAGSEMTVGRWYLGQHLYIAAIGRFRAVIDKYPTSANVPEALERLVECYVALGIMDEAKKNAAVLGYNYPGSDWYADAYDLLKSRGVLMDEKK
ncbi:MAG: outer membrane protein assembly factor BamD [Alphaproteobacteria bacterium]|nr:outer membrane protein assembly factor BamD [Alphaproteobacteria bacterium]